MGGIFRPELVESNARILAKVLSEDHVNYETSITGSTT